MANITDLSGRRILIVEDEVLIALLLESMLKQLGCVVAATAMRAADALALIAAGEQSFDAATLDIDLGGESADEIAAFLDARRIPFVVVTGYLDPVVLSRYANRPIISKPLVAEHLGIGLQRLWPSPGGNNRQ